MKRALIVVDYQNDFVKGTLGFSGAEALEQPICQLIQQARQQGDAVLFTFDTHDEEYSNTKEGQKLPVAHCLDGTTGWALYGKVATMLQPDDPMFCKPTFGSAELFDYLRAHDFEEIKLVGLVSYICVISNAVLAKAALPEAEIIVDANAVGGLDVALQNKAFEVMEGMHISVINRKEDVK